MGFGHLKAGVCLDVTCFSSPIGDRGGAQQELHLQSNHNNYEQGQSHFKLIEFLLSFPAVCTKNKAAGSRGEEEGKMRGTVPTSVGCGDMVICYTNHSAWKNLSSNWCSYHPNPSDHSQPHSP